jgi:CheY-like chemotaxis protein
MQSVGQLAAGVAHDFNNVLTIIQGHCELVAMGEKLSKSGLDSLDQVRMAADRAAKLTQQLLTFGRKQFMQMELLDINEVIQQVTQMLRRVLGENISLRTNLASRLPAIEADATMMEQVIMNLSVNARDAMPGGGSLTIGTVPVMVSHAYVERNPEAREGTFICLSVSDNGTGIESDKLSKLFEPFFTTKEVGKGTGLGLSMVHGFVKQSRGHIGIYSEMGAGTVIRIYLPRIDGFRDDEALEAARAMPRGNERILVVEDDAQVRAAVSAQLQDLGYRISQASDGAAGLVAFESAASPYDLLLTDIIMPGKFNGKALADVVKGRWPATRVVFMSGYSEKAIIHDGRLDPGVLLLTKPFRKVEVAETIRCCLDGTTGRGTERWSGEHRKEGLAMKKSDVSGSKASRH